MEDDDYDLDEYMVEEVRIRIKKWVRDELRKLRLKRGHRNLEGLNDVIVRLIAVYNMSKDYNGKGTQKLLHGAEEGDSGEVGITRR